MKLAEVELQGTSRAEILYFPWSLFCVMNMVSLHPGPKTAYLAISKNRPISGLKNNVIKGYQNMK